MIEDIQPDEPIPETDETGEPVEAKETPLRDVQPSSVRVAIVGQPNVGKSSAMNQLIRMERSIVSEVNLQRCR